MIENGDRVSIEYTLKLDDGTVAASNVGQEPPVYEQGGGNFFPKLEEAFESMGVNARKQVTLSAEQGFGAVDPSQFRTVDFDLVPEEARTMGVEVLSADAQGQRFSARVCEVGAEAVVLEFNHRLAGQRLHFDVKVVGIVR